MSEHSLMILGVVVIGLECVFTGFLVFRSFRKSDPLEETIAAIRLEARRALSQYRP